MKSTEDYIDEANKLGYDPAEISAFVAGCRFMEPTTVDFNHNTPLVSPKHKMVSAFGFGEEEEEEAALAGALAEVAEKNGLTKNDMMHLLPLVLRMLKSKVGWAG